MFQQFSLKAGRTVRPAPAALAMVLLLVNCLSARIAVAAATVDQRKAGLVLLVVDENHVAVASALVTLTEHNTQTRFNGETDYSGRYSFMDLRPGSYELRVEKQGFYAVVIKEVLAGEATSLEITLNHPREFSETMDVAYSPPAIDRAQTAAAEGLSGQEILTIPYPSTRDIRNALPFIPGVVQDASGQLHLNGSATNQILNLLDGFNISHPVNGALELRLSADAVRSAEVQGSRYSAELGKGSGGALSLTTGMGDDRLRFSATNFVPSVQNRKGLHLDNWSPRATLSGPIRKKRAWFFEAADAEYNLDIFEDLPAGADRNSSWRFSNLMKSQVNLSQKDILSAALLINRFHSDHAGLSRFDPLETTIGLTESAWLLTMKEQSYLSNGLLVEAGLAVTRFSDQALPLGQAPYLIRPEGTSGNYFRTAKDRSQRVQFIANVIFPGLDWRGRHDLKTGIDIDGISYRQSFQRRPISIFRDDGTLSRTITFFDGPAFRRTNFEASAFAQDRWSLSSRLLLEAGLRADWDEIIRSVALSPRSALTYLISEDGNTKLSGGIGVSHDAASLDFVTRPMAGRRVDFHYAEDGRTLLDQTSASFEADEASLQSPRFLNWSAAVDRRLPHSVYLRGEFLQKRGSRGFTFVNHAASRSAGLFDLRNEGRDRYDALQVSVRKVFRRYSIFGAYTRSAARSNSVIDFRIDNPVFSRQSGGPLSWDAPNRFLSWGSAPLVSHFDFAYSLEWRDGYPFSLFNSEQQIVGRPNSRRLPSFFSLNAHIERRLRFVGYQWSLRGGFNNLTNRANPSGVDSNIDSPHFLTFGGLQHRTFVGRLRFLGRK